MILIILCKKCENFIFNIAFTYFTFCYVLFEQRNDQKLSNFSLSILNFQDREMYNNMTCKSQYTLKPSLKYFCH